MSTSNTNNPFYCVAGTKFHPGALSLGDRLDYIHEALKGELESYGGSKKKTKICGSLSKFLGGDHDIDEMKDNVKMSAEALGLTDQSGNGKDSCTLRSCLKQRQITNQLHPLTNQQLYFFQYGALPPEVPLFQGYSLQEEEARRERRRLKQAKKLETRKAKKVANKIRKSSSSSKKSADDAAGATTTTTTKSLPATSSTTRSSTVTLKDLQDKISVPPRKGTYSVGSGRAGVSRANRGSRGRGRGRPKKRLQPGRRMEIEPVPDVGPMFGEEIGGGGGGGDTKTGVGPSDVENREQFDPPEAGGGGGNVKVHPERMTVLRSLDESIAQLKQNLKWE